ncbi:MAG: ABC transporter ATP-binding protein, partial [Thermoplasmata archaeon]|nr:ABC transporter ATP-binding protein [Thermoplasmata archaeon]
TGLARRVLLAAGLVGDPAVLLLDEPTLGLDPAARQDLRRTLRGLREKGITILLSTHLLEDVEEVCDRVLFLRDGRLVGDEAVVSTPTDADGRSLAALRLRFASTVTGSQISAALPFVAEVEMPGANEVLLRFRGGDGEKADLVAAIVGAGLPLIGVAEPTGELARRYMERVGREEVSE